MDALDFLLTRRSRPAKTLRAPAPAGDALDRILLAGLRVPDHGMLEPWRLIVLDHAACARLADVLGEVGAAAGWAPEKIEKGQMSWANAPMIVAVVMCPVESPKAPKVEQVLSAGAVCLSLVNAALASGWGGNWITGPAAFERGFLDALGLSAEEEIAGFIHLGTPAVTPEDRARPDPSARVTRIVD